jgi:CRP-like cAMP-binding protein
MCIAPELLQQYDASLNRFKKGEYLFHANWPAHFYFQIAEGSVKMVNHTENNDFIQGIFVSNESFGEPPLFGNFPYPADAQAISDSKIWILTKEAFFLLLRENPDTHLALTQALACRLCRKANLLKDSASLSPEQRILNVIDYYKCEYEARHGRRGTPYEVPFTRQLIADMLGLRVETVIRKIQYLADAGSISLQNGKVYRP